MRFVFLSGPTFWGEKVLMGSFLETWSMYFRSYSSMIRYGLGRRLSMTWDVGRPAHPVSVISFALSSSSPIPWISVGITTGWYVIVTHVVNDPPYVLTSIPDCHALLGCGTARQICRACKTHFCTSMTALRKMIAPHSQCPIRIRFRGGVEFFRPPTWRRRIGIRGGNKGASALES